MDVRFTDRELDIMEVLWTHGPSTVAEVREALPDPLAHNTVLTMLGILHEKGHVSRTAEGRAHRYAALVERHEAGAGALRRITRRLFQGSREALLLNLVEPGEVTPEELKRLRRLLDARIREMEDDA